MAKPRDAPKYWDDSYEAVVAGVEMRDTPTRLADILGTYVWLFSGDPEWGGDVVAMHHDYTDDAAFIARHSIMLGAAKHRPGQSVAPEDVSGHITWGTFTVAFDGMRRVRKGRSSNAAVVESYWEVLLNEKQDDEDSARWLDTEGNGVGVSVVLDDNGSPFLVFEWHLGGGGHSSWSGYYLGKRLVKGKEWQLTTNEQDRLGMEARFRSVERSVKGGRPRVYEEDEGEEDYYGRSDEDEISGEETSGEEAVREKSKASSDERGAKKKKVSSDERGSTSKKRKASSDERGSTSKKRKASTNKTGTKKRRR
ncbi:hypothetical protein F5887DRAFT_973443 [Amanita rubescens]|nr:hypothetical protein F5887DRAFT_973443 [Amanita rubescens]